MIGSQCDHVILWGAYRWSRWSLWSGGSWGSWGALCTNSTAITSRFATLHNDGDGEREMERERGVNDVSMKDLVVLRELLKCLSCSHYPQGNHTNAHLDTIPLFHCPQKQWFWNRKAKLDFGAVPNPWRFSCKT